MVRPNAACAGQGYFTPIGLGYVQGVFETSWTLSDMARRLECDPKTVRFAQIRSSIVPQNRKIYFTLSIPFRTLSCCHRLPEPPAKCKLLFSEIGTDVVGVRGRYFRFCLALVRRPDLSAAAARIASVVPISNLFCVRSEGSIMESRILSALSSAKAAAPLERTAGKLGRSSSVSWSNSATFMRGGLHGMDQWQKTNATTRGSRATR